jgi:signal transduction histidine kinase
MDREAPRILVVDDEPGIREGCRKVLLSEGYRVDTAEDGVAGLELIGREHGFAAALVDLKMPRMDGLEFIRRARERDEDIVLLVITAYASIESAVEATRDGAYGYIPKPFNPDELLLSVRNALERRALALEAKRLRQEREDHLLEVAYERSKSHTIINCMADGVLVVNRDGQIVMRNAAAERMLPAWGEVELPASLDAFPECDELKSLIAQVLRSPVAPRAASGELTQGPRTYMTTTSSVVGADGRPLGAVSILRDVTPLKAVEAAKSMFASMVAHEVKRPLAAIEGYLNEVLSAPGETSEDCRRMLEASLLRSRGLRQLVSELMDITAMDAGRFRLDRRPMDIRPGLKEAVFAASDKAEAQGVALSLDCDDPSSGSPVLADTDAVLAILGNLLDNAIKYTPRGGHVSVCARRNGPYVTVSVADDGIGMTAEDAAHAFDEFFRVRNERTAEIAGTGLGLSIVKRFVEMHDGKVSLRSAPGRGSEFAVSLPVARGERSEEGPTGR